MDKQALLMQSGFIHNVIAIPTAADRVADAAIKIINEQEKRIAELEAERRWIPVADRLPDSSLIGHLFMCYDAAAKQHETMLFDYIDGECFWVSGWVIPNRTRPNISHWMPLPSPPIDTGSEG
jgi:hypothetical protein